MAANRKVAIITENMEDDFKMLPVPDSDPDEREVNAGKSFFSNFKMKTAFISYPMIALLCKLFLFFSPQLT